MNENAASASQGAEKIGMIKKKAHTVINKMGIQVHTR